jgi:hypothetical protein
MKKNILLLIGGLFLVGGSLHAQCDITNLDTAYCVNDGAVTMGSTGGAGIFSGPGVSGESFDPAVAGVGTHTIAFSEVSYTLDQTGTYGPIAGSGTALTLSDDQTSAALPIGFTFNFFGADYTDFYISSNGFLGFSAGMPQGCCSGGTIPTAGGPDNFIAFSWDDMYPTVTGTLEYFVTGTAPNRALVVNFFDIPFCCGTTSVVKTQTIMYETSNVIEIHTEYANGVNPGTMGIENLDGTLGYAVPGRNSAAWPNLVNDFVSFTPNPLCSSTFDLEVLALPTVVATANFSSVCAGDSVIFTGSGADSLFVWDNGVIDSVSFSVASTMDYTVTGYDSTGCANTAIVNVAAIALPTVVATVDFSTVCAGDSVIFTGSGADSLFAWDNGVMDSVSFSVASTMDYTVTGYDSTGCFNTAVINVATIALPVLVATSDFDGVCPGDSIVLTGLGADSLMVWDNGVIDSVSFIPASTMDYTLTGYDSTGCSNTTIITVEVFTIPTVSTMADFSVCDGESITLNGSGADSTFTWDNSVMDGVSFVPTSTMGYTVTGYDSTGCSNTAIVNVTVNPNPTATFVDTDEIFGTDGSIVSTTVGGTAPYTYDWDNDGTGDFDDAADLTGVVSGTYTVVIMDANGCTYTETMTIDSQLSIGEIEGLEFSIYPNPSTGLFQITLETEALENLSYEVVNTLGQVITTEKITSSTVSVDVSGNESGIYYVKIISQKGTSVKSIILK